MRASVILHFKCVCVWQRLDNDNDAETMRLCADFIEFEYRLHTITTVTVTETRCVYMCVRTYVRAIAWKRVNEQERAKDEQSKHTYFYCDDEIKRCEFYHIFIFAFCRLHYMQFNYADQNRFRSIYLLLFFFTLIFLCTSLQKTT